MTGRIILLTGETEAAYFETFLLERNPELDVIHASSLEALKEAVLACDGNARLISFLTDIIVPPAVLERLKLTPYNIHPGAPEYPGSHPESWAIWENSPHHGVTAHEMVAKVDAGAIVAVLRFPMPINPQRVALNDYTYGQAIKVFAVVAAHCAETDAPMPVMNEDWSGIKRTKRDFNALCQAPVGASSDLLLKLRAACGPSLQTHNPVSKSA